MTESLCRLTSSGVVVSMMAKNRFLTGV